MNDSNQVRSPRKVAIADHIWEAFDAMAQQMGTERDGLINQAMFMFARNNGFLETPGGAAPVDGVGDDAFTPEGFDDEAPAEVPDVPPEEARTPPPAPPRPHTPAPRASREVELPEPPVLPPSGKRAEDGDLRRRSASPASFEARSGPMDNDPDRKAVAEKVLETAAELERLIKGKQQSGEAPGGPESTGAGDSVAPVAAKALYVVAEDGEMDKVVKDRFLIGRGKHCDLVINSGKVSREHAVIVREGSDFFVEDLGSSNGTWFNKQRIKRRKVEDGDEYFICSEKVKCVIR